MVGLGLRSETSASASSSTTKMSSKGKGVDRNPAAAAASSSLSMSTSTSNIPAAATSYVVSKIDAGQAVLISDAVHCIEFPSILLPPGCTQGSVVSISCARDMKEETRRSDEFWDLQDDIYGAFGNVSPTPPALRLRHITQTSVTLEWDKLELATAQLLSLTVWRNGQRLAAIPNPYNNTSTKVSGLEVDKDYTFHLMLRTTAGNFSSQSIRTRTLSMSDTSGIAVCFGEVEPPELLAQAKDALSQMRAKSQQRVQIETTHFVCTQTYPGKPNSWNTRGGGPGEEPNPAVEYQRANQLSIPIVSPSWVLACLAEKRMVPIAAHPAGVDNAQSQPLGSRGSSASSSQHQAQVPRRGSHPPIQLQNPPPPRKASVGSADARSEPSKTAASSAQVSPNPTIPEEEVHVEKLPVDDSKSEAVPESEADIAPPAPKKEEPLDTEDLEPETPSAGVERISLSTTTAAASVPLPETASVEDENEELAESAAGNASMEDVRL